jgi:hypothetical protein
MTTEEIKIDYEKVLVARDLARQNNRKQQEKKKFNYLNLIWTTREGEKCKVKDMERTHVQNSLNWCIRNQGMQGRSKDGILYTDWITYFTARLFDPKCE